MHQLSIHTDGHTATSRHPDEAAAVAPQHAHLTRADVYLYPAPDSGGTSRDQLIALPDPNTRSPQARPRITGTATITDLDAQALFAKRLS
jgi:hypothetical protein